SITLIRTLVFKLFVLLHEPWRRCSADQNVASANNGLVHYGTVLLQQAVSLFASVAADVGIWLRKLKVVFHAARVLLCFSFIDSVKERPAKSSVDRRLVEHYGVFDVVAFKRKHSHYGVLSGWTVFKPKQVYRLCAHHWSLRIEHEMLPHIGACIHQRCRESETLLCHRAFVSVSWRLVVLSIWNYRSAYTQDRWREYLQVRVLWL